MALSKETVRGVRSPIFALIVLFRSEELFKTPGAPGMDLPQSPHRKGWAPMRTLISVTKRRKSSSFLIPLNQKGQGLTEYIALLLLIAVACFAATRGLGSIVKSKITEARNHINSDISIQN